MRPRSPPHVIALPWLGALRVTGPDAEAFLQGQLSNDMAALDDAYSLLAGLHNPQGRVLALLRLARNGEQDVIALLPRELAASVAQHLGKYVLRSRVRIEALAGAAVLGEYYDDGARRYALGQAAPPVDSAAAQRWHLQDLQAGLPQVYGATSGRFIAQQLNLDRIGAISFDKGCYTGQEIIARAHYRGQVRRRMSRHTLPAGALPGGQLPAPGATLTLPEGGDARVVDAERGEAGAVELLLVPAQAPATELNPPT